MNRRARHRAIGGEFVMPVPAGVTSSTASTDSRLGSRLATGADDLPEQSIPTTPQDAGQQWPAVTERITGSVRRRRWLDRIGGYELRVEPTPSTTRQAEALNTAIAAPPTSPEALLWGHDVMTGNSVFEDPIERYRRGEVSGVNVVITGAVGEGKSAGIKCLFVDRQLLLQGRRVFLTDKKPAATGGGEYTALVHALQAEKGPQFATVVAFRTDGSGSRLNLFDPALTRNPTKHATLVRMVAELATGRPIQGLTIGVLRRAREAVPAIATADDRPVGDINDLVHALRNPTQAAATEIGISLERACDVGVDLACELERLVDEGDLAGLMDGPTTPDVSLSARLTVFDVSELPEDGPALAIVMAVIQELVLTEIQAAHARGERNPVINATEEGWHLLDGPPAKIIRRNWKLSRGLGQSNVAALHRISDVPPGSVGEAILKDAEYKMMYRQSTEDDAKRCVEYFGLPPECKDILLQLRPGTFLLKVGTDDPILVAHDRSPWEEGVTDTDVALGQLVDVTEWTDGRGRDAGTGTADETDLDGVAV